MLTISFVGLCLVMCRPGCHAHFWSVDVHGCGICGGLGVFGRVYAGSLELFLRTECSFM
jgi:hypothetical protein